MPSQAVLETARIGPGDLHRARRDYDRPGADIIRQCLRGISDEALDGALSACILGQPEG